MLCIHTTTLLHGLAKYSVEVGLSRTVINTRSQHCSSNHIYLSMYEAIKQRRRHVFRIFTIGIACRENRAVLVPISRYIKILRHQRGRQRPQASSGLECFFWGTVFRHVPRPRPSHTFTLTPALLGFKLRTRQSLLMTSRFLQHSSTFTTTA